MNLHHIRIQQNPGSTRGILMRHDPIIAEKMIWICDILEDGFNKIKVYGKTRIDPKEYYVVPIRYGTFYEKYAAKHGHRCALALMDTPGVDKAGRHGQIRVHKLNKVSDTLGCPGTGNIVEYNEKTRLFEIPYGESEPAYLRLYDTLFEIYDAGKNEFTEPVFWKITEQFV